MEITVSTYDTKNLIPDEGDPRPTAEFDSMQN